MSKEFREERTVAGEGWGYYGVRRKSLRHFCRKQVPDSSAGFIRVYLALTYPAANTPCTTHMLPNLCFTAACKEKNVNRSDTFLHLYAAAIWHFMLGTC